MERGLSPTEAAQYAIMSIASKYPSFFGALLAVKRNGEYGAACNGMKEFPFSIATSDKVIVETVKCV